MAPIRRGLSTKSGPTSRKAEALFKEVFDPVEGDDSDSYCEGSNKRKKTTKPNFVKRQSIVSRFGPRPEVPEMSDYEEDLDADEELWHQKHKQDKKKSPIMVNPKTGVLKIEFKTSSGEDAYVEVNLADHMVNLSSDRSMTALVPATKVTTTPYNVSDIGNKVCQIRDALYKKAYTNFHKKGFLDLPNEIRDRIYDEVFVTKRCINLRERKLFQRSAAFLRTCKEIHEQGRQVLYGRNSFHMARNREYRGRFCDEEWQPIGYKDIRRFLETIGPVNVSMIKYISFMFDDVAAALKTLVDYERQFVHDPVLHHVLQLIGSQTTLDKLVLSFSDRYVIAPRYYYFLKALTTIKCHKLRVVKKGTPSFIRSLTQMTEKMKMVMEIPYHLRDPVEVYRIRKLNVQTTLEDDLGPGQQYCGESATKSIH